MDKISKMKYEMQEQLYISSFNVSLSNNTYSIDIYCNDIMSHSLPVTINILSDVILSLNDIHENIITRSYPLSYDKEWTGFVFKYLRLELIVSVMIRLCITLVVSYFGPMIIRERSQSLLKQLNLNGINNKCYWSATLIVTFILTYLLSIGIVVLYGLIGIEAFRHLINLAVTFTFLIFCCLSTILFQYWISFYFERENNSYLIYILINFIPSIYHMLMSIIYDTVSEITQDSILSIQSEIYTVFGCSLFPSVNIPMVILRIMRIYSLHSNNKIDFSILVGKDFRSIFIGNVISILICTWMVIYETRENRKSKVRSVNERTKKEKETNILKLKERDDDVYMEYQRVANYIQEEPITICTQKDSISNSYENDIENINENENKNNDNQLSQMPIRIVSIAKEYPCYKFIKDIDKLMELVNNKDPKFGDYHFTNYNSGGLVVTSLRDVSLGINQHECFGLIGPNGSGKTTLLSVMAYNDTQNAGKVYFDGIENIKIKDDHFMIGYCPQNDILWDELTLYEHLIMYIYFRGFSKKECKEYANNYMKFCKIEEHKNKYPHELSGGTRRKLCILLALISFTSKIILDEPSSGMDPATRRYVWNILTDYKNNENSSIVITTHSMEEAEILCDRIGILVNGELHAIGSPAHIKMKFGNTYTLEIQCTDSTLVNDWIKKDIPRMNEEDVKCEIKSDKRIKYTFQITENHSEIFKIMEDYKAKNIVTDYSYTQTSLEDVFLKFSNLQENKQM